MVAPNSPRPIVNLVTAEGKRTTMLIPTFMLHYLTGEKPNAWHDCSHICGNPRCILPAHLRWEPKDINISRELCQNKKYAHLNHICNHDPPCIKTERLTKGDMIHRFLRKIHK